MTFDPRALRDAFGAFLTGVTVVTIVDAEGHPLGFTANSFTSVSLDPPLLLVCLAKSSRNCDSFRTARGYAVNILSAEQKEVSNTFARPVPDRFATIGWAPGPHGSPVLDGVAAWFDCALHDLVDGGDHLILIGRVEAFHNAGSVGLGYARGGYFSPTMLDKALLRHGDLPQVIGLVAERDGEVFLVGDEGQPLALPTLEIAGDDGLAAALQHVASLSGVPVTSGLLYSVYADTRTGRQHVIYRATLGPGPLAAGGLHPIGALPLDRVQDAATRDVLRRFEAESGFGNFGVYVGDQDKGRIHVLSTRG
jgi:flavin-dependent trigonelline monooxygenase, reductase component